MRKLSLFLCLAPLALACGDDDGGGDDAPRYDGAGNPDADPNAPDADPSAPDAPPGMPDALVGYDAPVTPGCGPGDPLPGRMQVTSTTFSSPILVTQPPGDTRLFVVEQGGRIRIVSGGMTLGTPFLDISGGDFTSGGEQGLLGLAFHPSYAANGRFFLDYTDNNGDTVIGEYRVSADPNVAMPAQVQRILFITQPYSNHNGGNLLFGPDGYLYIGMGDGGSGGDPDGNGQNLGTLLGKMLRIDVDGGSPYAIPPGNPFAGMGGRRPEIWAYGLRNPWRFSFDRTTGDLWIGDVGQGAWEEIDFEPAGVGGRNYGWSCREGNHDYDGCPGTFIGPVFEYSHGSGPFIGQSVTGGYVYRGSALPSCYQGAYFFADYVDGWVASFKYTGSPVANADVTDQTMLSGGNVSSFGQDSAGELYIVGHSSGRIYKVIPGP